MIFSFSQPAHPSACARKQKERQSKIDSLPAEYSTPLSLNDEKIHSLSLTQLVSQCRSGEITPTAIMAAYAKKTLTAHKATNCVTDFMFEEALLIPPVANWGPDVDPETSVQGSTRGPTLLGVPVSIKDTVDIKGHDTTVGYSRNVGRPSASSSAIVRLLQDAGALVHVKTTVPTGLIAIETSSDVFGRTSNPYNTDYTAGASTGGGAALLACGGSKIEIGTDVGGSVRLPAHFCGIWSLKSSAGRFPSWGCTSSLPGLEGVPIVTSPMASNLEDLKEFWVRVIEAEPWQYDHTCIPMPWKQINLRDDGRRLKWGVMWEDGKCLISLRLDGKLIWGEGAIPPTPASRRALQLVISALKKQGHEVVDFQPPDAWTGLKIGYQLLSGDGGEQLASPLTGSESLTPPTTAINELLSLPKTFKKFLSYLARTTDQLSSELYAIMHKKTVAEERALVVQRDEYRAQWHKKWIDEGLDFVLTVPCSLPAIPHGASEKTTLISAGYTFLFSLLDYSAGVLPVTHVDKDLDSLPQDFASSESYKSLTSIAKLAYTIYDAEKMHGLPLGVQVIGRRLEEEKVLEGMQLIESALKEAGSVFVNQVKL